MSCQRWCTFRHLSTRKKLAWWPSMMPKLQLKMCYWWFVEWIISLEFAMSEDIKEKKRKINHTNFASLWNLWSNGNITSTHFMSVLTSVPIQSQSNNKNKYCIVYFHKLNKNYFNFLQISIFSPWQPSESWSQADREFSMTSHSTSNSPGKGLISAPRTK